MAKILVVSPTPSHPQDAGNRARIHSLLNSLKADGHWIGFVFQRMEDGDEAAMAEAWDRFVAVPYNRPRTRRMKRWFDNLTSCFGSRVVAPYLIDEWYDDALSEILVKLDAEIRPDVVLVEYAYMSRAFTNFATGPLKILDTHDVMTDRHRLCLANGMPAMWFYTTRGQERKALERADRIMAIQKEEAAYFASLTRRPVLTVGHLPALRENTDEVDGTPGRMLFVGSNNPINIAALAWFIRVVLPDIRRAMPMVQLEVAGSCAEHIEPQDGLLLTGRVKDLDVIYREAAVVINPVRFGTGLKIKAIEALAMGRPMVSTPEGIAGLEEGAGQSFLVAKSPETFSAAVLEILRDPVLRGKLRRAAFTYAETYRRHVMMPLRELPVLTGRGTE